MTVVTQFLGTGSDLKELKRFYVQGGTVFSNPEPTIPGMSGNSITQEWCDTQKTVFNEEIYPFNEFGGMASMGKGMGLGMVLVMSLWDDHYANMLWLDSTYPTDRDPESPGAARGECDVMSGVPAEVEAQVPNAQVVFSNIKFGPIGSTFKQPA
jgi:cellulose 1,4-beta-cellobiosidase